MAHISEIKDEQLRAYVRSLPAHDRHMVMHVYAHGYHNGWMSRASFVHPSPHSWTRENPMEAA